MRLHTSLVALVCIALGLLAWRELHCAREADPPRDAGVHSSARVPVLAPLPARSDAEREPCSAELTVLFPASVQLPKHGRVDVRFEAANATGHLPRVAFTTPVADGTAAAWHTTLASDGYAWDVGPLACRDYRVFAVATSRDPTAQCVGAPLEFEGEATPLRGLRMTCTLRERRTVR